MSAVRVRDILADRVAEAKVASANAPVAARMSSRSDKRQHYYVSEMRVWNRLLEDAKAWQAPNEDELVNVAHMPSQANQPSVLVNEEEELGFLKTQVRLYDRSRLAWDKRECTQALNFVDLMGFAKFSSGELGKVGAWILRVLACCGATQFNA